MKRTSKDKILIAAWWLFFIIVCIVAWLIIDFKLK
jgi:hypothetical protein